MPALMASVSTTRSLSQLSKKVKSVNSTASFFSQPPPSMSPEITASSMPAWGVARAKNLAMGEPGNIASMPGTKLGLVRLRATSNTTRLKAE